MKKIITQQQKISCPKTFEDLRHGMMTQRGSIVDMLKFRPTNQEIVSRFTGLDSVGGIFFLRQLEFIKQKVFEVQHTPLTFRQLFPVTSEAGAGRKYVTYRTYDRTATAQMLTNLSDDFPRVDVTGKEESIPIKWIGASFGYTLGDIQASRVAGGEPLDAKKAKAAFEGIETDLNSLAFYGSDLNFTAGTVPSLFNNSEIPKMTAAQGVSGSTAWVDKTPDEQLADVNAGFAAINNNSKNVFSGNTWALPISTYNKISGAPRSINSDTTVLNYIVQNSPYLAGIDSVIKVPEFTGAASVIGGFTGNDTNDVMLFYNKNSDCLEYQVPVEYQQEAPQQRNLEFIINCWGNVAGLFVFQPLSMQWVAGI